MTPAATLDSDDIHLMTQVGFIAAGRADVHHAERIFGALALARPQHDFPHVGMAAALEDHLAIGVQAEIGRRRRAGQ